MKAEDTTEGSNSYSRISFKKTCTLPKETDPNSLKCFFEDGRLRIEAAFKSEEIQTGREIPIQFY